MFPRKTNRFKFANRRKNRSRQEKIDLFKVIPALSSLGALFGGLIFFVYFESIKFTPELDLNSSFSLLLAAALLGCILLVSFAFIFMIPGLIWFNFRKPRAESMKIEKELFSIFFFCPFIFSFLPLIIYDLIYGFTFNLFLLKIFLWAFIFISFLLLFWNICFFIHLLYRFIHHFYSQISLNNIYLNIISFVMLLFVYMPFMFKVNSNIGLEILRSFILLITYFWSGITVSLFLYKKARSPRLLRKTERYILKIDECLILVGDWLVSMFIGQFIGNTILFYLIYSSAENSSKYTIFLRIASILTINFICNFVILDILLKNETILSYLKVIATAFIAIVIVFIFFIGPNYIPSLVMKNFGWGNLSNIEIIVDDTGCQIFSMANSKKIKCENLNNENNSLYKIDEVDLLLGLGDVYYFEINNSSSNSSNVESDKIRVRISKSNIRSVIH